MDDKKNDDDSVDDSVDNSSKDGSNDDSLKDELSSLFESFNNKLNFEDLTNSVNSDVKNNSSQKSNLKDVSNIFDSLEKNLPPQFRSTLSQMFKSSTDNNPNYEIDNSKMIAKRIIGVNGNTPIISAEVQFYIDSVAKANLWLDTWTNFEPNRGANIRVINQNDWVEGSVSTWIKFAKPYVDFISDASISGFQTLRDDIESNNEDNDKKAEAQIGLNIPGVGMTQLPFNSPDQFETLIKTLNRQGLTEHVGKLIASFSGKVFSGSDFGLDLFQDDYVFIPQNINKYLKDNNAPEDFKMFIVLREVGFTRFFHNVHWFSSYILSLIKKILECGTVTMPSIDEMMSGIDPTDEMSMQNSIKHVQNINPEELVKLNDEQVELLMDLQVLIALAESWVDYTAFRAGSVLLREISTIYEFYLRRHYSDSSAQAVISKLIGFEIKNSQYSAAYSFWEKYSSIDQNNTNESCDKIWSNIDNLPKRLDSKSIQDFMNNWKNDDFEHDWDSLLD